MGNVMYVDLALPLQNGNEEEKGFPTSNLQPVISYETHEEHAGDGAAILGIPEEEFSAMAVGNNAHWKLGAAWETLEIVGHAGTHVDAPWHFFPTTADGTEKALSVDELPLDWFFGDGVVIDLTHIGDGERADVADIEAALEKIGYEIKPDDIVCLRFDKDKDHGTAKYWRGWPGISAGVVEYFTDRGVHVIGTDSLGQDASFSTQYAEYQETGSIDRMWEAHRMGVHRRFCNLEKMANLDQLPPFGFKIACPPMPIKGGSGAWCRPVAIVKS
ncbi:MAG: cyclase family protein [Raoultibacter sp.]